MCLNKIKLHLKLKLKSLVTLISSPKNLESSIKQLMKASLTIQASQKKIISSLHIQVTVTQFVENSNLRGSKVMELYLQIKVLKVQLKLRVIILIPKS